MSTRSSRRLSKIQATPEGLEYTSYLGNNKKVTKTKKIRKTGELLFFNFDSTHTENDKTTKKQLPLISKKSDEVHKDEDSFSENLSPMKREKNSKVIAATDIEMGNRKIVKAKRFLKKAKNQTDVINPLQQCDDSDKENGCFVKPKKLNSTKMQTPDAFEEHESSDEDLKGEINYSKTESTSPRLRNEQEEKVCIDLTQSRSEDWNFNLETADNVESGLHSPDVKELQIRDHTIEETSISENTKEENNNFNMVVTLLPSPISPSLRSLEEYNSPNSSAKSPKMELRPSLNGDSNISTKRRTYELENSIIDLSVLKSASKESRKSEDKTPPPVTFSRVTQRRKWKVSPSSFQIHGSPVWAGSLDKKLNKTNTPFPPTKMLQLGKKSASSVKKVPNFAAIHQKAMDKIESISEYKERKEERAKMLLSGKKPTESARVSEKKGRKQLRFAANTTLKEKPLDFIPLPSTPLPKRVPNESFDESPASSKQDNCGINQALPIKFDKPHLFKLDKPTFAFGSKDKNDGKTMNNVPQFKFDKPTFAVGLKDIFNKKVQKEGLYEDKMSHIPLSKFPKLSRNDNKIFERKVLLEKKNNINQCSSSSQSTFKSKVHKQEQIISIACKTKTVKNNLESRKCAIKGVRSNRRFELLMNMRKGK